MKISKKRNKIKGRSITCSYIWHINMCVLIRHTFCESLVKICPKNQLESQKSSHARIILYKIWCFSKYSRPLHKLVYAVGALQTVTDRIPKIMGT